MRLILLLVLSLSMSLSHAEKILNKNDTDYIFSLDRNGWESYVKKMASPEGWKARTMPLETGTTIMAFDATTGYGLSIQAIYLDSTKSPSTLTVGSYYPAGFLPEVNKEYLDKVKAATEQDLGPIYIVSVRKSNPPLIGIEIMVMRHE